MKEAKEGVGGKGNTTEQKCVNILWCVCVPECVCKGLFILLTVELTVCAEAEAEAEL